MKFKVDEKLESKLNIDGILLAVLEDIDLNAQMPEKFEKEIDELTQKAKDITDEMLSQNQILEGYRDKIRAIKRSLKRYPPAGEALVNNIKRRGEFPRINTLVDLYNMGAFKSMLSIGAHDLDSFTGDLRFEFVEQADSFTAVGGGSKPVHVGDYVYRDEEQIVAYLDARDAEDFKVLDTTKNVLLVIQGNSNTSLDFREEILEEICQNIKEVCGGDYKIYRALPGQEVVIR